MAIKSEEELFQSEDVTWEIQVLNEDQTAAVDVSTWTLSWMLKRSLRDLDVNALLHKTSGAGIVVSGAFNADPTLSAQRVRITISASDTAGLEPGICHHELKRTDGSLETVLSYGLCTLIRTVHRA